ncbi:MAG: gliding motility-associated C-terminal domain-containing protein [Saprospiraceae bacterium]
MLFRAEVFAQCNFSVNAGPDIKVCKSGDMAMMAGKVIGSIKEVYWDPPTGLSDPKNPGSKVTINGNMEYVLVAKGYSGINLVTNGDFESGKTGFFTDYIVGTVPCYGFGYLDCEGTYDVINNSQLGHSAWSACKDHTSGSGLMMVLNGAAAFQNVWCQTVPVIPDMDYVFTAWITSVTPSSPPILQFNINGQSIGPTFNSSGAPCSWEKYEVIWNSGSNTSADICILNENTNTGGNDFAVDDISFQKICEKRDTMRVDVEEININIEDPGIVNCDRPQVKIDATGSSNGKNWTIKWTTSNGKIISGDNTLQPIIEGPGTYEITICSPLPNCCKKAFIEIMGNIKPPDLDLVVTDSIGCNNSVATIFSKSNTNNLNYFWVGPNGFMSNDQNVDVYLGGTYTLTIIDEFNCKSKKSIVVFENADNPKIVIQSNNINCKTDSAKLVGTCSIKGSKLEWYGPKGFYSKTDSVVTKDSGVYILKIVTPNGCIKFDSVRILKDKKIPQLTFKSDSINCKKDSATIQVFSKENLFYSAWEGLQTFRIIDSSKIRTSSSGNYNFIGIADNGCADTLSINIFSDKAIPFAQAYEDTINCIKSKVLLYSSRKDQTTSIDWSGPNGFNSTKDSILVSDAGTYDLIITGTNYCSNQISVKINIDTTHPILVVEEDTLTCLKDKLNLSLKDLYSSSYSWTGPNGFTSNNKNPLINLPGTYFVDAQLSNGCHTLSSVKIADNKMLPLIQTKDDTLNCLKDSLTLNASSDNSSAVFEWSGPNNYSSNQKNPLIKSPGNYQLIVSNSNGCKDSMLIKISQDVRKPVLFVSDDTINCKKTTASLIAKSNRDSLIYLWSGPNSFSSTDSFINVSHAGKYKIKVITPEFCNAELELNVFVDTIHANIQLLKDTLNCLKTTINLQSNITGGVITDYNWSGPAGFTSKIPNPGIQNGGTYNLQVLSSNYCIQSANIFILQDTVRPTIQLISDTINCLKPEAKLSALIIPNNLVGTWSSSGIPNTNSNTLLTKAAGSYTFKVISNNYCSSESSISVEIDTLRPDLIVQGDTITCRNVTANLIASSKTTQLKYKWTGPNGFQSVKSNDSTKNAGNYSVIVTAVNGCSETKSIVIEIDTLLPLIVTQADSIDCTHNFAQLKSIVSQNNAQLIWKNVNQDSVGNQKNLLTNKSGLYSLTATNPENFCSAISYVYVVEDSLIIKDVIINTTNPICGAQFGSTQILKVVGGHTGLKYSLDNGLHFSTQTNFSSLKPSVYTLLVLDDKLCEFKKNFEIFELPLINTDLNPEIIIQLGESGILDLNIISDKNLIKSIQWLPDIFLSCNDCEDPEASPLKNIEYEVTVTDTNGCKSIQRILVKVEDPQVWVPNVFSPNGDQINDWAYVVGSGKKVTRINVFQIYDRWGNRVFSNEKFQPNEMTSGWNGKYKGQDCNPAVYVYWLEVELINGKKWKLYGDITLLR